MSGVIELSMGGGAALVVGRGIGHAPAPLGSGSAALRASASRIALTTASTVSSKRLPSVEMIRASVAARSGATARVESSSSRRRRASRMAIASGPSGSRPALLGPATGPLHDRCLEEDLEVRIGQDDRADVAARHDDPAAVDQPALPLEQRGPQLRDGGDGGHGGIDRRAPDIRGVVDVIDKDARQGARTIRRELDLVDEAAHRVRVRGGHVPGEGQPRHRPIQQPRVAEPVAELQRGRLADTAFARRTRAVEGDDEALAVRRVHRGRIPRPVEPTGLVGALPAPVRAGDPTGVSPPRTAPPRPGRTRRTPRGPSGRRSSPWRPPPSPAGREGSA